VSGARQDSLAFYLSGLVVGITSTTLVYLFNIPAWTVPLLMFLATAVGFVVVDAVRRHSVARSYMFRSTGTYTLGRHDGPPNR
jgi:hypothetical protein